MTSRRPSSAPSALQSTARLLRSGLNLLLAFGLAWALAACSSPPQPPASLARNDFESVRRHVEALIRHEMREHGVTGLSIALVDDQRIAWAFGTGWADQAARRPADAHTVYRMGSVSKLFTDLAALQLVEQGRLRLDMPLVEALPGFRLQLRDGSAAPTLRQLMTHHAGLPRDHAAGMWFDARQPAPTLAERVQALSGSEAAYPPGRIFSYSNIGLTLLGAVVERAAGQAFEQQLQQRVLAPLGMGSASFSAAPPPDAAMSKAYRQGRAIDEPALADVPAGGLNASVTDLAQFMKAVFADGRPVLQSPATLREMLRVQNGEVPLDQDFRVGLGWMLSTLGGEPLEGVDGVGPVAHHGGATVAFRSQLVLAPAQRLGVIVAANSSTAAPVVNRVAQRALALAIQARTGIAAPAESSPAPPPPVVDWPPAMRAALEGEYTSLAGRVRVLRHGEGLRAEALGQTFDLLPLADGSVRIRLRLFGLLPWSLGELDRLTLKLVPVDGRELLVGRIGRQTMRVGQRLPPPRPLPAALAALAGRYEPELQPGEYAFVEHTTVAVERGRLVARWRLRGEDETEVGFVIDPIDDRHGRILQTLADGGEVVRLDTRPDGAVTFRAAGYRWRRVAP